MLKGTGESSCHLNSGVTHNGRSIAALSSDWHIFISITLFLFLFFIFYFLSLATTVLPCPLELTGGLLTNHQCFDVWTTKIYKT